MTIVGVWGLEPQRITPTDFLTTIAFATIANDYVCELDYVMILPSIRFRPEPFSLYTFLFFNRLGSALVYIPLEAS